MSPFKITKKQGEQNCSQSRNKSLDSIMILLLYKYLEPKWGPIVLLEVQALFWRVFSLKNGCFRNPPKS